MKIAKASLTRLLSANSISDCGGSVDDAAVSVLCSPRKSGDETTIKSTVTVTFRELRELIRLHDCGPINPDEIKLQITAEQLNGRGRLHYLLKYTTPEKKDVVLNGKLLAEMAKSYMAFLDASIPGGVFQHYKKNGSQATIVGPFVPEEPSTDKRHPLVNVHYFNGYVTIYFNFQDFSDWVNFVLETQLVAEKPAVAKNTTKQKEVQK